MPSPAPSPTPRPSKRKLGRMLADPRAADTVRAFHEQWLELEGLDTVSKDAAYYPSFDESLRASMRTEAETFLERVVLEDGHLSTLLTAPFSYVNADMAAFLRRDGALQGLVEGQLELDPARRPPDAAGAAGDSRKAQPELTRVPRQVRARGAAVPATSAAASGCHHRAAGPRPQRDDQTTIRTTLQRPCLRLLPPADGSGGLRIRALRRDRSIPNQGRKSPRRRQGRVAADGRRGRAVRRGRRAGGALGPERPGSRLRCTALVPRFALKRGEEGDESSLTLAEKKFAASDYDIRELLVSIVLTHGFRYRRSAQ